MDVFADLAPVADNYAVLPVGEAFNWAPVASLIEPGEWYMVAFRSIVRADADQERLRQYDDWAHEEAVGRQGLHSLLQGPAGARPKLPLVLHVEQPGRSPRGVRSAGPSERR